MFFFGEGEGRGGRLDGASDRSCHTTVSASPLACWAKRSRSLLFSPFFSLQILFLGALCLLLGAYWLTCLGYRMGEVGSGEGGVRWMGSDERGVEGGGKRVGKVGKVGSGQRDARPGQNRKRQRGSRVLRSIEEKHARARSR